MAQPVKAQPNVVRSIALADALRDGIGNRCPLKKATRSPQNSRHREAWEPLTMEALFRSRFAPMLFWFRHFALLVLACCASACSMWPWQTVPAVAVPNDQYVGMSCEELRAENDRLLQEAVDLRPQLAPGQAEEQRKKDFALISGEMDALNRVRAAKKC